MTRFCIAGFCMVMALLGLMPPTDWLVFGILTFAAIASIIIPEIVEWREAKGLREVGDDIKNLTRTVDSVPWGWRGSKRPNDQ